MFLNECIKDKNNVVTPQHYLSESGISIYYHSHFHFMYVSTSPLIFYICIIIFLQPIFHFYHHYYFYFSLLIIYFFSANFHEQSQSVT